MDGMPDVFAKRSVDRVGHQADTENTAVRRLLQQAGGHSLAAEVCREYRDEHQSKSVPLSWFCNRYEKFPYWLGYRKVSHQRDALLLCKTRLTRTPCYKAWQEIDQDNPSDRPTACIFGWPRFGTCVIRSVRHLPDIEDDGFWMICRLKKQKMVFLIEPFKQFCEKMDPRWIE